MQNEKRHQAVTELATRLLATATAAYESAPKLVLDDASVIPPPLSWHVAYTSAQFLELMLRLCALRHVQATTSPEERTPIFDKMLEHTRIEANRCLKFFNIQLAQEI